MKPRLMMTFAFLSVTSLGTYAHQSPAATFYVRAAAVGGDGLSWAGAFNNLDSALDAASTNPGNHQIWIAKGMYNPSRKYGKVPETTYAGNEENLATFRLVNNVSIYGGFAGGETSISQRNREANPTILSGDLARNDFNDPSNALTLKGDNAWHVLTADGAKNVTLDGLIVSGGYASGPDAGMISPDRQFNVLSIDYGHSTGGGLLARNGSLVALNNMLFRYNGADQSRASLIGSPLLRSPALVSGGGGVSSMDEGTLITVKNSLFEYNTANGFGSNGGALKATLGGSLAISGSTFSNNTGNRAGGAIHAKNAHQIDIRGSRFNKNKVVGSAIGDESGGAISVLNTSLNVSASYFSDNVASPAGGGAIFFQQPFDDGEPYFINIDTSTFVNNQSGSIGGGAINIFGTLPNPGSAASIRNSLFINNMAAMGGGVYFDSIPSTLENSVFVGNKAWVNGGAVFGSNFGDAIFGVSDLADRRVLDVSKSTFSGNSIVGVPAGAADPTFVFNLFAFFQSFVNGLPLSGVTALHPGGGAIASELEGNVRISDSLFLYNKAPNGGALLVGGSDGCGTGTCDEGASQLFMDQAYASLQRSFCMGNKDSAGSNNTAILNPGGLDNGPNGVLLVSDGSCP